MSYDVYIGNRDRNITGNLGAFFAWALHDVCDENPQDRSDSRDGILGVKRSGGLKDLHGMLVADALPLITRAIERVAAADTEWLSRFDAPNGWGTAAGGANFLRWMRDACAAELEEGRTCPHCEKSTSVIRVSW